MKIDNRFFQQLSLDSWLKRLEALHQIEQHIKNETDLNLLLEVRAEFEKQYREEEGRVYTVEILRLREVFTERCLELRAATPEVFTILRSLVSDVLPDTYPDPDPFFHEQGPEWVTSSKWKVRIQAARALGLLGDRSAITTLMDQFAREWVKQVRRALALSISTLKSAQQDALLSYDAACDARDKSKALTAIERLVSAESDASIRQELLDLVKEIHGA